METNTKQRKIKIIAEVHPQHMGSIEELERMILQCKMGGADFVKVQLYSSKNLFNDDKRNYLELKTEFLRIVKYSKNIGIKLFASVFDEERFNWCEEANIELYKLQVEL